MKLQFLVFVTCLSFFTTTFAQVDSFMSKSHHSREWGAASIRLDFNFSIMSSSNITKKGKFELDCGFGVLNSFIIDRTGSFIASGSFTQEGGPTLPNPSSQTQNAKYFGHVYNEGRQMFFVIILSRDPAHPRTYTLTRGLMPTLHKCL